MAVSKNISDLTDLFSIKDYMAVTGRSKRLAYQDIREPGFPVIKLGERKFMIVKSGFITWLEKKMQEPKTA